MYIRVDGADDNQVTITVIASSAPDGWKAREVFDKMRDLGVNANFMLYPEDGVAQLSFYALLSPTEATPQGEE